MKALLSANELVDRVAALWRIEIELRGWTARDLAERSFAVCREMGYRVSATKIIEAAAKRFGVPSSAVMDTPPHPDTLHLVCRRGAR